MIPYLKNALVKRKLSSWILILAGFTMSGLAFIGCGPTPVSTQVRDLTGTAFNTTLVLPTATATPNTNYYFEILIAELERTMPEMHSEDFIIPDKSDEQAFHSMILAIMDDKPAALTATAAAFNYELLKFFDLGDSGAESYILREQQPIKKGWGLYFFRKQVSQDIVVEAPHPIADENTAEVSLDLYRALKAKALLVAGAHRDANADGSADPAHATDSIFQTVHTSLFKPAGLPDNKTIFLQIHGYSTEEHPKIPQVVIGYNWQDDPEKDLLISKIVDALQQNNITVGLCKGKKFQGMCGTKNVQRLATDGGIFIHMELTEMVRRDDLALVTALQQALNP